MRKSLISAAALITIATSASAQTYNADAVKAACSDEWGAEFDMVKYCMDQRAEGFDTYIALKSAAPDMFAISFANCETEWGTEWEMVAYCAKSERDSAAQISSATQGLPDDIANIITSNCTREWANEFTMIAYCSKQQAAAWRSVNQ